MRSPEHSGHASNQPVRVFALGSQEKSNQPVRSFTVGMQENNNQPVRSFALSRQEEMFQLPSLLLGGGRSLRTITTAGGTAGRTFGGDLLHLSDLAPSSSEDEMEESVVMEFDLHSDGSGDGALW